MWRPTLTKSIACAAVLLLAVSSGSAVASDGGQAKKTKQADLVVKTVTGSISGRTATVSATVTNKPGKKSGKKSKAAAVAFVLSADTAADAGDTALGQSPLPKLKPKKSATVTGSFSIAATVPAGSYYLVACADPGSVVKEKKEQNNCSTGVTKVTIAATPTTPTPGTTVTVTYSSAFVPLGTVSGTASNGSCAPNPATGGGVCTVTSGAGTVVLTAAPAAIGITFTGYTPGSSGPCDGAVAGSTVTFTAPATNKSCVASFGA